MPCAGERCAAACGLLVVLVVAAGCVSAVPRARFRATAGAPVVMPPPWTPYDGSGMTQGRGTMTIATDDAVNTGAVDIDLTTADGRRYVVHWTDFHDQPGQAWQDGGIAAGVVEHGASGHGNKMEPQLDLASGGWGTASASVDGKPLVDPVTGAAVLNAHYMVTKEAMLEPGTMKIYKSDRKAIFDPRTPGDGYVFPGRTEGHFALWGAGAYTDGYAFHAPSTTELDFSDVVTGPGYDQAFPVSIPGVMTRLMVAARLTGGAGQLTVTLKDPGGKTISSADLTTVQRTAQLDIPDGPMVRGNDTLEVRGTGVQASYDVSVSVAPPTPFLLHVVFQTVQAG